MIKPLIEHNSEQVLDFIRDSITDHDVGWAWIDGPSVTKIQKGKIKESSLVMHVAGWRTSQKKFKVTVTEI